MSEFDDSLKDELAPVIKLNLFTNKKQKENKWEIKRTKKERKKKNLN